MNIKEMMDAYYCSEERWLAYCNGKKKQDFRGLKTIIIVDGSAMTPAEYWESRLSNDIRWKPNSREEYFKINGNGEVKGIFYSSSKYDKMYYELGNVFKTEEEAKEAVKRVKYMREYKDWAMKCNDEINWNNHVQCKYAVYYNHVAKSIEIVTATTTQQSGAVYFTEKDDILDFINKIGGSNFKKYILEIED